MPRKKSGGFFRRILRLLVVAAIVFCGLAVFRYGKPPEILLESELPGIGKKTPVHVEISEPSRGLSELRVELIQGDRTVKLAEKAFEPLEFWEFWGERQKTEAMTLQVGSQTVENLEEGPATIRVVAQRAGTWIRQPEPAVRELALPVRLRPPSMQVISSRTFVTQGGSETVVYRVGETTVRDGVQSGDWWFPGYPLPGGATGERFALFGAPFDLDDRSKIRLSATDDVGNRAEAEFIDRFVPQPFSSDNIVISKSFLERVVPSIMARTPEIRDRGSLLDNYLAINGELRAQNSEVLMELSRASVPEFYWNRPFQQMRNAKVMSDFADRRTYLYESRAVDRQDHLGLDLASVRMADIQAANTGVVVLARYFGIYGNAVVIDHGYGLLSLYGHLSSLSVEPGQPVERGDVIGRSGQTGLAGGDHLHFTILLHGLSVDPREWWDGHWIQDRMALKLGPAFPFER